MQYTQDYDEILPPAYMKGGTPFIAISWDNMTAAYMGMKVVEKGSPQIFQCPSDTVVRTSAGYTPRSYSMIRGNNGVVNVATVTTNGVLAVMSKPLSAIPAPSSTLMVSEYHQDANRFGYSDNSFVDWPMTTASRNKGTQNCPLNADCTTAQAIEPVHMGGWNYLFADGHAKWLKPERTIGPTGNPNTPRGMWTVNEDD